MPSSTMQFVAHSYHVWVHPLAQQANIIVSARKDQSHEYTHVLHEGVS